LLDTADETAAILLDGSASEVKLGTSKGDVIADFSNLSFSVSDNTNVPYITEVTSSTYGTANVDGSTLTVKYFKVDSTGTKAIYSGDDKVASTETTATSGKINTAGTYYAVVYNENSPTKVAVKFTITASTTKSLAGCYLINGTDTTKTTFTYTGEEQTIGVALGDKALTASTHYSITYYDEAGTELDNAPTKVGKYYALVVGDGTTYSNTGSQKLTFNITPYDLSKADITIPESTLTGSPATASLSAAVAKAAIADTTESKLFGEGVSDGQGGSDKVKGALKYTVQGEDNAVINETGAYTVKVELDTSALEEAIKKT
jgi:hypothetical protein